MAWAAVETEPGMHFSGESNARRCRHQENVETASFEGSGRGGVGREIAFLTNTTPSARKEVASPIFLDARIHPSSAEEGNAHSIKQLNRSWFVIASNRIFFIAPRIIRRAKAGKKSRLPKIVVTVALEQLQW